MECELKSSAAVRLCKHLKHCLWDVRFPQRREFSLLWHELWRRAQLHVVTTESQSEIPRRENVTSLTECWSSCTRHRISTSKHAGLTTCHVQLQPDEQALASSGALSITSSLIEAVYRLKSTMWLQPTAQMPVKWGVFIHNEVAQSSIHPAVDKPIHSSIRTSHNMSLTVAPGESRIIYSLLHLTKARYVMVYINLMYFNRFSVP
jgi:hypothetical protein